jgi:hypothetical protein
MCEYRCDERLKGKDEGSTRLEYTWLCRGLEHLKIDDLEDILSPSIFKLMRSVAVLVKMFPLGATGGGERP